MDVTIEAGTLTASRADRIVTGLLLPYGEVGRTNLGRFSVDPATISIPTDPSVVTLNIEHARETPVGRAMTLTDTSAGIIAAFSIAKTPEGDAYLDEVESGARNSLSAEVSDIVLKAGKALGGRLFGAAGCIAGAFPSATLLASDVGEAQLPPDQEEHSTSTSTVVIDGVEYVRKTESTYVTTTTPRDKPKDEAEQSAESETEMSTLTAAAVTAAGIGGTNANPEKEKTAQEVFTMLASAFRSGGQPKQSTLLAALANVVHDDGDNDGDGLGEISAAPEWLGEVYAKAAYVRKYIPLIAQGNLTAFQQKGFSFGTLPVVAKYTGNKADVPTGGMTATPISFLVDRWAHAADLDRRYIDFGDSGVIQAFVEAQVESYKKVTDIDTLVNIIANATTFTPGTVPSGINATLAAIVDGALNLIGKDLNPTFAIVGSDIYRSLALTKKDEVPEYLASAVGLKVGSVDGFQIIPSSHANALQNVIVGDGSTLRFKELGGGAPIRVEAEHVAQGGRDLGVFGYTSFQELLDGGVVKADIVP